MSGCYLSSSTCPGRLCSQTFVVRTTFQPTSNENHLPSQNYVYIQADRYQGFTCDERDGSVIGAILKYVVITILTGGRPMVSDCLGMYNVHRPFGFQSRIF